ncbi:ABC transporter substrate-binding protein [Zavarzinia sp. CC-PAN008]|uniref:ABC transporter substrate-binding protein n=1 Tax=Zavarzinia sp. CC-PAN008 TaxID=3243332 RepID=UPI003F748C87
MIRRLVLGAAALILSAAPAWAENVTLRIGYIPVAGVSQLFVIDGQGWAKEQGIDLQLTKFDSGPNAIQALASGTLDGYYAGYGPLVVARDKGLDVRVVATTAIEELALVAGGPLAEELAKGGTPAEAIQRLHAATGKPVKFATQPAGSVPNTFLQYWLWNVAKLDKSQVEIVSQGIDATQQAILAGAVDAATIREPALTIVRDRKADVVVLAKGGDMFPKQPGSVVGMTGAFIQAHPDAAKAFVALHVRATEFLQKTPAEAAPFVAAALGKGLVSEETIAKALTSEASVFIADPRVIEQAVAEVQAFQVQIGAIQKEIPLDGLFDASLYLAATGAQ